MTYDDTRRIILLWVANDNGVLDHATYASPAKNLRLERLLEMRDAVTTPNGAQSNYQGLAYDALGRLVEAAYDGGDVESFTYDSLGNIRERDGILAAGRRVRL